MRSRVIEMYDWTQMDLSEFAAHFAPDEKKITEECNRLANRRASWKDGIQISAGDMATISMESKEKRYQRSSMTLAVGSNMFDKELEQALIGMEVGETKQVQLNKASVTIPVTVTVESVKNNNHGDRECGFLSGTDGSFPVPLALNLTAYNEIKKSCVPFS